MNPHGMLRFEELSFKGGFGVRFNNPNHDGTLHSSNRSNPWGFTQNRPKTLSRWHAASFKSHHYVGIHENEPKNVHMGASKKGAYKPTGRNIAALRGAKRSHRRHRAAPFSEPSSYRGGKEGNAPRRVAKQSKPHESPLTQPRSFRKKNNYPRDMKAENPVKTRCRPVFSSPTPGVPSLRPRRTAELQGGRGEPTQARQRVPPETCPRDKSLGLVPGAGLFPPRAEPPEARTAQPTVTPQTSVPGQHPVLGGV